MSAGIPPWRGFRRAGQRASKYTSSIVVDIEDMDSVGILTRSLLHQTYLHVFHHLDFALVHDSLARALTLLLILYSE